jgi:HEAT repeat protein
MGEHRAGRPARAAARQITMQDLLADLTSGDDARAERAIPALVEFGAAAIPPLLELTRSPNPDLRWWGICALAASPHTQTGDLIHHLSDSAPEVRAAAALALCSHPGEEAIPALIRTLADADPLTAGLAGNALTRIGSPTVASLLHVMEEAPSHIRILALRTLSEIGDHRAIPVMMKCLNENDSAVLQYWARQGLERLGLDMVYIKP